MAQNPSDVAHSVEAHGVEAPVTDELRTPEEKRKVALTWVVVLGAIAIFSLRRPDVAYTILMFVITLSVLVFVHEWGHYQFGRWGGMKINRFAIGFPPFIYTKRKNGIDYSIGALPIGGMVDIAGLGSEEEMVATTKGQASPIDAPNPHKPHGQKNFQDATLGWRFLTLFAGPLMNFIFALVVFALVFSLVGVPITKAVTNQVDFVYAGMPADVAGVQAGDRVIGVGDVRSNDTQKIRDLIQAGNGKAVSVVIERNGKEIQRSLTPQIEDELQADGVTTKKAALIGVMFTRVVEYKRVGLLRGETGFSDGAIGVGLMASKELASNILSLLRRVVTLRLTADDKRNIGGPVKIAQAVGHTANKSWQETILLAATLSVNLGLMNLLPIPALDGGRIMFIIYEAITRRPFDHRKESIVNAVGMVMVLTFMLFMTFRDVLPMLRKAF
ncbi:MAG TPA: M50 family metallopeptidase [Abditibacteriaceae bacterium]|jgi:regulator of sigma E protease